jgi:methionyl-tRNA synthetase
LDAPRLSDIALYASIHHTPISTAYPALSTWIQAFGQLPFVQNALSLLSANVTLKDPPIIADASHRKINSDNTISLDKTPNKTPIEGQENILITSALPYVNNVPHLGTIIGSTLSADAFSRYCRISGVNAIYICGTDEYGTATETKALEQGVSCQELCDHYHAIHAESYKWFEIDFDHFGRTTTPNQTQIAQEIFTNIDKNGFIVKDTMTQLYCEQCHRFLADRYVEGTCPKCAYPDARGDQCDQCGNLLNATELVNPRCKLDGNTPIQKDSQHLFLDLGKLQPQCEAWFQESSTAGKWTANSKVITQSWLTEGLRPRCITRDLKWGTPVPMEGYEDKVFYVWFDAPIGYISITAAYTDEWQKWWKNPTNVKLYQFMGKDNVAFHTVIFPSTLMADGRPWTMLHHINTTDYLHYEHKKFSKSKGVGVFCNDVASTGISASAWRYYLFSARPETSDSMFMWSELIAKNNNELVANLGNLCNRVLKFTNDKYNAIIPTYETDERSTALTVQVSAMLTTYMDHMRKVHLRSGLKLAMDLSALGNLYLQDSHLDNTLFATQRSVCDTVIATSVNLLYLLGSLVYPFMPSTAESIWRQLNAPSRRVAAGWTFDLLPGHRIGRPEYLFKRIEPSMEHEWQRRFGGPGHSTK